jgi:hypothetical protein
MSRIRSRFAFSRSSPLNVIEPPTIFPGGEISRIIDRAVIDFAAARLANQPEKLALRQIKTHVVDRLYKARTGREVGPEVFYF